MKIYRVETQDGSGPYRSDIGAKHECGKEIPCADAEHPIVIDETRHWDGRLRSRPWYENTLFAFDSIKQLENWFKGYIETLNAEGFGVGIYEASEAIVLPKQVMYNRNSARRLSWRSLTAGSPGKMPYGTPSIEANPVPKTGLSTDAKDTI